MFSDETNFNLHTSCSLWIISFKEPVKSSNMKKKTCNTCDTNIKRQEQFLDCNSCKQSHHAPCTDLPDDEYSVNASKKSSQKWYCRLNDPAVTEILSNFEKFKKLNAEV